MNLNKGGIIMALQRGIVELDNFSLEWAKDYEKEKELLREVLGDRAIEIHHVGSTSIKGLKAKPVIDILVAIEDLNMIEEIEELLNEYDYSNRGHQGVEDRYFFAKGPEEARTHYIHFVEPKNNTYYNLVLFKKYLIEHEEYIKKYCDLKQELAKKYPDERKKYTAGKSEFITEVVRLARDEYNV